MQQPVRIFVRQPAINRNRNEGTRIPPIAVCRGDRTDTAHEVDIAVDGMTVARIVYRPDEPLEPSGATVFVELLDGCTAHPVQ